jgi:putative oxidoreductase
MRLPTSTDWALVFVRIALGTVFIMHGWPKIADLSRPIGMVGKMGYEPAAFFGVGLAVIEFGGGILLLLGLATRLAALLIAITQVIAVKEVHWPCGYSGAEGCSGYEFNFVLLCGLVALILAGAGAYSMDRGIARARGS